MRDEITTTLKNIDLRPLNFYEIDKAKCAINLRPTDLLNAADAILKYKYIIKQVALSYGKTATFMPKVLANAKAASLTLELILEKEAAYFYAGIIKHFKALQAFIHTSSASYKDPITKPKFINNRIYFNVDSLMPAYDGFAAILLAGMDGILNKITEENFQSSDSLAASINFLSHNMDFLIKDNVFSKAQISEYIAKKQQEVDKISQSLCALEFKLYYHL
jgi:glutamine synthetase